MSWIDKARQRETKKAETIRKDREAEEAKKVARAAFKAKIAATAAENLEAERTKALNRYASDIKRVLPRGVEIVGAFFSDRPEVLPLIPAVRVDLGNSVQFDLELGRYSQWSGGYSGGACGSGWVAATERTGTTLTAYEAGGPILSTIKKTFLGRPSSKHFSKREVENLLFKASEKHNLGSG